MCFDFGMERNCKICDRDFSRPYNLRRHYQEFHPLENQPKRLRMSRIWRPQNSAVGPRGNDSTSKLQRQARGSLRRVNGVNMEQYGGRVHESADMDSEDDEEDGDSMTNGDGSASESDAESDTSLDSVDNGDDPDWVFPL